MMSKAAVFLGLVAGASAAGQSHGGLRTSLLKTNTPAEEATGSLVQSLSYKHQLRVCNAYPYSAALDVFRGEKEELTAGSPMGYKSCRDFSANLKAGDKLEFKVGEASAGTFSVSDLPNNDATLLLVIHRHDTLSTAVSFESHVFANLKNSQVAIIDTYKGAAKATPFIKDGVDSKKDDKKDKKEKARREEMRYNSVIAVNQGKYKVLLDDAEGKEVAESNFVALDNQVYVVMRTGVESQQGESFPEELVVFPQSDPAALPHSGAAPRSFVALLLSVAVFLAAALPTL